MDILKTVREVGGNDLWVAGGFVRNLIWDLLHNYKHRSELGDIDVFYFDEYNLDKKKEKELARKLKKKLPNVNWSVKNQARMHTHDNLPAYSDLENALSHFPETASAVAVQLNYANVIEILSPLGLSDLFSLIVRPTPKALLNEVTLIRYFERQKEKKWSIYWPQLKFYNS